VLASIYMPFMLLKHLAKYIFPQGSLDLFALPQCMQDVHGGYSLWQSEGVVFNLRVLIQITPLQSSDLNHSSFGAWKAIEVYHLLSE